MGNGNYARFTNLSIIHWTVGILIKRHPQSLLGYPKLNIPSVLDSNLKHPIVFINTLASDETLSTLTTLSITPVCKKTPLLDPINIQKQELT